MNERIKEIAIKVAGDYSKDDYWSFFNEELEKFAELVVKECANELLKWRYEPFPLDADSAARIIKQHFGIK